MPSRFSLWRWVPGPPPTSPATWSFSSCIFDLTAVWFVCKGMGKRFSRYASCVHVVDFGRRNVLLYLKSDPKKAQVVAYKNIKNYKLIRQGGSLRLLLAGNWLTHPSGYQLVDINRPFMKDSWTVLPPRSRTS